MRISQYEEFLVTNGTEKEFQLSGNELGDVCPSEFYLYIDSDITVTVTGYANDEETLIPKVVNIGTLSKEDTIEEAGEYLIMSSPYKKIKLAFGGNANAIVKVVI